MERAWRSRLHERIRDENDGELTDRYEGGRLTWISGGGAWRTVEKGEWMFEDGGERERVVHALLLHLAVDGGEASGDGSGGDGTVRYGCHLVWLQRERECEVGA